jgi:hypothetical protein
MEHIELTDHLRSNYIEWKKTENLEIPSKYPILPTQELKDHLKKFLFHFLWDDVLKDLVEIPDRIENKYRKDISFFIEDEEIKNHCLKKIKTLAGLYEENQYARIFSVDNFHNEVFEDTNLRELTDEVLNTVLSLEEVFNISKNELNIEVLKPIIEEEKNKISFAFSILINSHLKKEKLSRIGNEDITEKKLERELSQNQTLLVLERLDLLKKIDNLNLTAQAKILSDIIGFSKHNIRKTLVKSTSPNHKLTRQEKDDIQVVDEYLFKYKKII